jgi:iron complex transport system ATP-binding protein
MTVKSLSVNNLAFSYNDAPFLEEISVTLVPGRVMGIAGPNGAGKTTLMNLLAGHLTPTRGEVKLGDDPIRHIGRKALAREIALIPPEVQAPFAYTVWDVVEMGRYPHADAFRPLTEADRVIIRKALARTGLEGFEEKVYNRLSSGERQRAVIARALAQEPHVLLMDEPMVHLDIHYQVELHELMTSMAHDHGLAVLIITHDLNFASQYCDDLILMESGRIVRRGGPSDVMDAELLSRVYRTRLEVHAHPRTGRPTVWPAAYETNQGERP